MHRQFRVVNLSSASGKPNEQVVDAPSPEAAAIQAIGTELVRSGAKTDLMAQVYWQRPGEPLSMVRFYRKVDNLRARKRAQAVAENPAAGTGTR